MPINKFEKRWRAIVRPPEPDSPLIAPEDLTSTGRRGRKRGERLWEFTPMNVRDIRERFGLSQKDFARLIGISPETLRNWESCRRCPCGPSRSLLRVMRAEPELVAKVLRWHITREPDAWRRERW